MKGGNWVPPEMIYSNISKEKLMYDRSLRASKFQYASYLGWGNLGWT